jgi:hypothetical protein
MRQEFKGTWLCKPFAGQVPLSSSESALHNGRIARSSRSVFLAETLYSSQAKFIKQPSLV